MSVELEEVSEFLAAHEPFVHLPQPTLSALMRQGDMRYIRRGEVVIARGQRNDRLYVLRSGAVDVVGADDVLLDRLDPGRTFGYSTLVGEPESHYDIITLEDCLVISFSRETFSQLVAEHPQVSRFYSTSARSLERDEAEYSQADRATAEVMRRRVREVGSQRGSVTVNPETSIADTAAVMAEKNISSILIAEGTQLVGIVTDKDLRRRVVAQRTNTDLPVREVMTAHPITIEPEDLVLDALLTMSEHGVQHLPVGKRGELGVITAGDITRALRSNPIYLAGEISSLSRSELRGAYTRAAETIARSLGSALSGTEASRVLTSVADSLVRRLVALATEDLGSAPVDWSFVAVGSQGRREMGPASDQDNALVLADNYDPEAHGEYFTKLATYVCEGLHDAGQMLCPGEMMAMTDSWRMTVTQWVRTFHRWVTAPEPDALLHAQIYFDMRVIAGSLELGEQVRATGAQIARNAPRFHAHLAALAARREPPLGFFRGFVVERGGEYADTLDIKKGGTAPLAQIARLYAIVAGVDALSTRDRLEQAAGNSVSRSAATDLIEAFDYLTALGHSHQSEQLRHGQATDYHIDPNSLSSMQREHLRDAFRAIQKIQTAIASTYPVRNT